MPRPVTPCIQPGPIDGGTADEHCIGTLTRFVPLDFDGGQNIVDCAIAEVKEGAILNEICSLVQINGTVRAQRNMTVFKHGRTTGLTSGVITDIEADIRVEYDGGRAGLFINQLVIRGKPGLHPSAIMVTPARQSWTRIIGSAACYSQPPGMRMSHG